MAPDPESFVLKLANYCECDGCHKTLKKLLELDGVHSTLIDAKTGELTVSGPVDPQKVIKFLEKKGKKAKLVMEEIQPKRNNYCNVQIITLPAASMPQPVVVQEFKGLKQLEVTYSMNVKVTFNGKNIDEVSTQSDTRIKMVMDDDRYRGRGTGTSFRGPHLESATPWQENYFPLQELRPVAGYEPSAPQLSRQVWVMRKV
ncbi:hypothetical protein RHGRI_035737 [Rhododendron griersonianum]|uniref:HMA domain-containing protein n=1 Tax=Rhododendron griersonianum TaxID=479676 RepID=A0AAV6HNR5_9ERIC|nr:hypothetical protein RHGRI_035737 [Rhododendron griersonianum]